MYFPTIDRKWKSGDKKLLAMYEQLEKAVENADVFYNPSGIHLHPDFVAKLPVFTVFGCYDDPENSKMLSKPVAAAYDLCLIGNIAEIDTYKSWGVKNVEWTPHGFHPDMCDDSLTYDSILNDKPERDIDLVMLIDKLASWRRERMDKMDKAFPDSHFYGRGWKRGYLPVGKEVGLLKRAKIGPNFHNSTGPINLRTFYLPINGVMQICDNKSHLGKIYKLNEEVVGFDTVEECIDLCRYYLAHDEERRKIAAAGWQRTVTDYNEIAVFQKFVVENIEKYYNKQERKTESGIVINYKKKNKNMFFVHKIASQPYFLIKKIKKTILRIFPSLRKI
jgi:hypothetical protein